ncbi:hypothetical protein C9374_001575 [Naegleria lovaniensis]|uniref:Uncharacterized protein n=1 Tax=Naegleria lovaniensis TaxID=51637 RepID=A0AA88GVT2_NAELO|nr:uncharacterized protein C9374_001575 [Naegleria lovaniensis]KAG2387243.1 hypothetical protein C9374_001575 [Naegleria lovaniensis]
MRAWPSFFLATMFLAGVVHGKDKQASLYRLANARAKQEEELVESYVKQLIEEDEKKAAAERGEDVSLYNVPPGLRQIAKTIKQQRSKNAPAQH